MVDDKLTLAKAQNEVVRLKALLSHAMKQLAERDGSTGGGGVGEDNMYGCMYMFVDMCVVVSIIVERIPFTYS